MRQTITQGFPGIPASLRASRAVCRDNPPMNFGKLPWLAMLGLSHAALAEPLVAVDVGHGLKDTGAVSARGRSEYEFNGVLARALENALQQRGLAVREINFAGDVASLTARTAQARGSDFFISIHHDSIAEAWLKPWVWEGVERTHTDVKRGYGIFVSQESPDLETSLRCASAIGSQMRRAGFEPTPWHARKHKPADAANGVWYYDHLVVLYRTTLPAVLFEAGVIKHQEEELELLDPARQALMADVVATGIAACMSVKP